MKKHDLKSHARTTAVLLVKQLRANGVDRIFCVPGESFLHVLDALLEFSEIEVVTCRHESGAAFMAEAHGKLTGRPGIAFVTRGPGATNASAGVHVAHQDSTPLILFVGHIERSDIGRGAFQEIDYATMFASFSKAVLPIMDGRRTVEIVNRAFALAMAGRRGPVIVPLPEDVLGQTLDVPAAGPAVIARSAPSAEDVAAVVRELEGARRPLVVVGGGGWSETASEALRNFAENWALPVAAAFRCQDFMDNASDCYVGDLGLGANPKLSSALAESDLLLAVGTRLGDITTGGYSLIDIPGPRQKLIHIYPDPSELGRVYQPELAIASTSPEALAALAGHAPPKGKPLWREHTVALRKAYLEWTSPPAMAGDLQLGEIMTYLRENLPPDAIVSNGAGNFAIWPNRFHRYRRFHGMLAPRSGSMGYGIPAAVAAKMCYPERVVIAFAGDGDFLMTGQELATAMQHKAAIVVLLINNGMYGTIRMHQEREFPGRVSATSLTNPDFVRLAEAYGAFAARITRTEQFTPAFEAALRSGRSALLELVAHPDMLSPNLTISGLRAAAAS